MWGRCPETAVGVPPYAGRMCEHTDWEARIAAFWETADDRDPDALLAHLLTLVEERGAETPEGLFELASGHDFIGEEATAVQLYRSALDAGLAGKRHGYAIIQLASSLRTTGEADEAVHLLTTELLERTGGPVGGQARDGASRVDPESDPESDPDDVTPAALAFLALALHDAGRPTEALRVALLALAPHLPGYGRAVEYYATVLGADEDEGED